MADLWKEVSSWLAEATRSAVKETEELATKGRLRTELLGISAELENKFAALGGLTYELLKKKRAPIKTNPKVKKLAKDIAELEERLKETKKGAGAGKKTKSSKPGKKAGAKGRKKGQSAKKKTSSATKTRKKPGRKKSAKTGKKSRS